MEGSLAKSANKWIKAKGLKSSSIPISFIPFNKNKDNCNCGNKYSKTLLFNQKYCKKCISGYIKLILNNNDNITDQLLHNIYLFKWVIIDVIIYTDNSIVCDNHEDKDFDKYEIQEFRGWCENCSKILYFKQVISDYLPSPSHIDDNCKLCGKAIEQHFLLCSDCYQISCRWVAGNTENSVLIIYLPWWDTHDQCIICNSQLNFTSDCQKWCLYCCIFYIGCSFCLTTNIIFGITNQSQCKKCERTSFIKINVTDIKECFLTWNHINQISNYISNIDKNSNPLEVYNFIKSLNCFPLKPSTDLISHSQITNLENNDENSAMPIMFIPFINEEEICYYCKRKYYQTLLFEQKYCKYCLFIYIKYSENNYNIDVCVSTKSTQCDKHEPRTLGFCAENIQEWCSYCSEISFFRQIVTKYKFDIMNYDQKIIINDHSQFFFESLESSLIKKPIPILYLPWWDAYYQCLVCNSQLELKSNCQKWCSNCFIIYTGCRYCLTTNIIFGITNQSQCKKCKRLLFTNINISGNDTIDKFLCITKLIIDDFQIDDYIKNTNPLEIYSYIKDKLNSSPSKLKIDWIPYSQIKNLEKIAEGGFGIIYKAKIDDKVVAVKGFLNSQDPSNDFLNELKSLYQCYDEKFECIIRCHGITKNPLTNEFMFIMKFANGGNLYNYLHDNFTSITWKEKLYILWRISDGLQTIHEKDFIHRDFHSGNILIEIIENGSCKVDQYLIGDLGLSQPANNTSSNNEIYGVIPYIAPEVFKGAKFSKASDIYSMGMIMWELTTGCKPFANIEHDSNFIYEIIDGKRPEITDDTPEDFANLMRKCWNSDPKKRPLAKKICETVNHWLTTKDDDHIFNQAEEIRLELIKSKSLGPEFSKPRHSHAIYTSRPLNSLISKSSVISTSMTSSNMKQNNKLETLIEESNTDNEYITKEYELDIDDTQRDSIIQNSNIQYCSNSLSSETNPLRKRNIEELNVEIQDNGKHIKISDEIDKEIKE